MKKIIHLPISLLLISCAQTYEIHTNLDKENFEDYFKPSQVKIVPLAELPKGFKSIAAISGASCQKTSNDRPASKAEATAQARIAAAELNANGVVVDVCETQQQTEIPECHVLLTCYARALTLPEPEQP